jgi:hypothetical protein
LFESARFRSEVAASAVVFVYQTPTAEPQGRGGTGVESVVDATAREALCVRIG